MKKRALITIASGFVLSSITAAGQLAAQSPSTISASDKASGDKANPQLLAEYGGAYAGPQAEYVRRVGQKIAVQSGLSNAQSDFHVTLLNSPVNNAFAIPGGYVYVTRELMALMNDEAELASVMGHEVGHVAARHANARSRTSTITGIGSLIIGVLTGSSQIAEIAGQAAQLYTLRFSRSQEYQADDLGITYLARAGYDPLAASTMLASLAAQSALDTSMAGASGRIPEWASTHPDPASRVTRAAQNAVKTGAKGGVHNRDAFLAALDGMLYGDDPHQGVVDGQIFRHPDLRLTFTAPASFAVANGADAVTISGTGGQARFKGAPFDGDLQHYVAAAFRTLAGNGATLDSGPISTMRVNGIDSASAVARAETQSGPVDVTVFAYAFDNRTAYQFVALTPAGQGSRAFAPLFASMRRLTPSEAAAIRPRRISVVTVGRSDTVASLAARMAYPNLRAERFLTLNALKSGVSLRAGQRVKLVVYG